MSWIAIKQKFTIKDNGVVYASCRGDDNKTEIHLERKWNMMIKRVCEILASKDNLGLPS